MTERILPKPRLIPKKKQPGCRCVSVFVVEQTRTVECQKCGRVMDPFDYLFVQAKWQDHVDLTIKILAAERNRLEKVVDGLKRQEKNIKGRLAAAKRNLHGH